jgi:hypothetical protein
MMMQVEKEMRTETPKFDLEFVQVFLRTEFHLCTYHVLRKVSFGPATSGTTALVDKRTFVVSRHAPLSMLSAISADVQLSSTSP